MKSPKPRLSVAATTRALASSFQLHPLHNDFLETAIKLCAADAIAKPNGASPQPTPEQLAAVSAEYAEALQALIFIPSEDRFYAIWSNVLDAGYLAHFADEAWRMALPGKYGKRPPQHWVQKKPPKRKQRKIA